MSSYQGGAPRGSGRSGGQGYRGRGGGRGKRQPPQYDRNNRSSNTNWQNGYRDQEFYPQNRGGYPAPQYPSYSWGEGGMNTPGGGVGGGMGHSGLADNERQQYIDLIQQLRRQIQTQQQRLVEVQRLRELLSSMTQQKNTLQAELKAAKAGSLLAASQLVEKATGEQKSGDDTVEPKEELTREALLSASKALQEDLATWKQQAQKAADESRELRRDLLDSQAQRAKLQKEYNLLLAVQRRGGTQHKGEKSDGPSESSGRSLQDVETIEKLVAINRMLRTENDKLRMEASSTPSKRERRLPAESPGLRSHQLKGSPKEKTATFTRTSPFDSGEWGQPVPSLESHGRKPFSTADVMMMMQRGRSGSGASNKGVSASNSLFGQPSGEDNNDTNGGLQSSGLDLFDGGVGGGLEPVNAMPSSFAQKDGGDDEKGGDKQPTEWDLGMSHTAVTTAASVFETSASPFDLFNKWGSQSPLPPPKDTKAQ